MVKMALTPASQAASMPSSEPPTTAITSLLCFLARRATLMTTFPRRQRKEKAGLFYSFPFPGILFSPAGPEKRGTDMTEQNKRRLRLALAIISAAAVLIIAALSAYRIWERPPERQEEAQPAELREEAEEALAPSSPAEAERAPTGRSDGVYTLLLAGLDRASSSTDTILVGRLDTGRRRLDLVSIPRDTIINRDWSVRKINAAYAAAANAGAVPLDGLREQIRCLTGFTPDCCAVVDLDVFEQAVDLAGGVDYEVPVPMHYDDPAQGLSIHLEPGLQHLDGKQAMGLVRYRSGYVNGDLDRVAVQQSFLRAAAAQFVSLGSIPNLRALALLLAEHTDTDLSAANVAFLLRQALLCGDEIHLAVMPNTPAETHGLSYTYVELEPWLDMLNESLNPFDLPITAANLDLVYRVDGRVYATSGILRGAEYYW